MPLIFIVQVVPVSHASGTGKSDGGRGVPMSDRRGDVLMSGHVGGAPMPGPSLDILVEQIPVLRQKVQAVLEVLDSWDEIVEVYKKARNIGDRN
jgi:hypothetical protein